MIGLELGLESGSQLAVQWITSENNSYSPLPTNLINDCRYLITQTRTKRQIDVQKDELTVGATKCRWKCFMRHIPPFLLLFLLGPYKDDANATAYPQLFVYIFVGCNLFWCITLGLYFAKLTSPLRLHAQKKNGVHYLGHVCQTPKCLATTCHFLLDVDH